MASSLRARVDAYLAERLRPASSSKNTWIIMLRLLLQMDNDPDISSGLRLKLVNYFKTQTEKNRHAKGKEAEVERAAEATLILYELKLPRISSKVSVH